MENKKIYNDDVERIVNDPERQWRIMVERSAKNGKKISALRDRAIFCFVMSVFSIFLGFFDLIVMWFALVIGVVFFSIFSFFLGRWFESWKTHTWRHRSR